MERTVEMAKKKVIHSPECIAIADAIMNAYDPKTAADAQETLKNAFCPIFEAMLKGEFENHLGYLWFRLSPSQISIITDSVLEESAKWQARP